MALSPWWAYNTALGNSEGLLAASVTWAIVAHLNGYRRGALALLTAASLMRPEVWPFLIAYGVWMWRADRRAVVLAGALVVLLWFGPDVVGAGGALGASKTGRGVPSPGSAKLADFPALALLGDTATLLTIPALIAVLLAAVLGDRTRPAARGRSGGMGGDRGADDDRGLRRQPALPRRRVRGRRRARRRGRGARRERAESVVPVCGTRARLSAALGALVLVAAVLAVTVGDLRTQFRELDSRAAAAGAFDGVLARAGGKDALLRCSRIRTSNRARSLVAWRLDLPLRDLDARPVRPAVVLRAKWFYGQGLEPGPQPGYRTLVTSPYWQIVASCGRAPQVGT